MTEAAVSSSGVAHPGAVVIADLLGVVDGAGGDLHLDGGPEPLGDRLSVPLDGLLEALLEGDLLLPAQRLELVGVDVVPLVVEVAVRDVRDEVVDRLPRVQDGARALGDLLDAVLVAAADVVDLTDDALVDDAREGARDVARMDERARVVARPLDGHLGAAAQEHHEARDDLLRVLVHAVDVVAARDDAREAEGQRVTLHNELGGRLGRRVRVGRVECRVLLLRLLDLAVNLVGRHVDELLDLVVHARALEQVVRAEHVVLCEGHRVAEGVVDVRLRGEVDDGVDVVGLEQVHHEVRVANVAAHEGVVRRVGDLDGALVGAVVHLVKVKDVHVRVQAHELVDEVGADEAAAARDEHVAQRPVRVAARHALFSVALAAKHSAGSRNKVQKL
eukprot:CAMPEP_0174835330 /NCGR_PEP_ID=MMETSP1114-20130205/5351_1 /TAXON_ID=312471 /ORGANISM="Neobodo designis, Strain CCAP 1951/1" /LENGTH=389 /DNA_ID=CAMNT_0016069277 /DNA_START=84 /DNA_END=1251 /DNA_ORIENTATION=+